MKALKLIAVSVAVAIMAGCSASESTGANVGGDGVETVKIGLTGRGWDYMNVYYDGKTWATYFGKEKNDGMNLLDTIWVDMPAVDSVYISTVNLNGEKISKIPIVADSTYKVAYK